MKRGLFSLRLKDSARCSVYEMLRKMCLQVKRKGSIRLVCIYRVYDQFHRLLFSELNPSLVA